MKQLVVFFIILASAVCVNGQKLYTCNLKRAYWTFDKNGSFLAVQLPGNAKPTERSNVITIGNYALQYVIVDKRNYLKGLADTTGVMPLISYAQSEGGYMSEQFNEKLNIEMSKAPLPDGTALIWSFDMPPHISAEVKKQIFIDVVIGDKIFGLSSSQFVDQTYDEVEDFLIRVISTLKKVNNADEFARLCGK